MVRHRITNLGRLLDSVPFRLKVIGLVLGVTFAIGSVSAIELRRDLYFALIEELDHRGVSIAQELAAAAGDDVATGDRYLLHTRLAASTRHNQDIAYAFVIDPGDGVVASTFPSGVPRELLALAPLNSDGRGVVSIEIGGTRIREATAQLYAGNDIARVRVGMSEDRIDAAMAQATGRMWGMTLIAGLAAVFMGLLFIQLLLRPLNDILEGMRRIAAGELGWRLAPAVDTDMAFLATSFNEMAEDIEAKTEELVAHHRRIESANRELSLLQRLSPGFIDATSPQQYLEACVNLSVAELSAAGGWACARVGDSDSFCSSSTVGTCSERKACIETCLLSCRLYVGSERDVPEDCPMHAFAPKGATSGSDFRDLRLTHAMIPSRDGANGFIALVHRREDFEAEIVKVVQAIGGQIGVVIENLILHADSEVRERRLASLLSSTLDAQENERNRVARELHDDIGQKLTYLKLGLKVLDEGVDSAAERTRLVATLRETVSDGIDGVRRAIANLAPAPLDDLGLLPALERLVRSSCAGAGMKGDFLKVGTPRTPLDPVVATAAYRIVQEAINNAVKHSDATRVSVVVRHADDDLDIVIEDNGVGFDVSAVRAQKESGMHLGLDGMRERCELVGGKLLIESGGTGGTTVHVRLPYAITRPNVPEEVFNG